MGIMEMVRKWKEKNSEKSERFKEMQEQDRLENMLLERKKSSNRRELESYYKKLEEDDVKRQLDKIHKKQNHESWKGKNMFGGKCTILKSDKSILTNNNSMFKQSNSFMSRAGGF
jgi:hypothetical protein